MSAVQAHDRIVGAMTTTYVDASCHVAGSRIDDVPGAVIGSASIRHIDRLAIGGDGHAVNAKGIVEGPDDGIG